MLHRQMKTQTTEQAISPDPDDDFLFDLCKKVNADYLITSISNSLISDHHLVLEIITFTQLRTFYN